MSVNDYRKQVRETSEPDLSTNLGRLIASAPAAAAPAESRECGNCFEGKSDGDHICRKCNGTGEHATAGNAAPTDRNGVLEQAAQACEARVIKPVSSVHDEAHNMTVRRCASEIRSLKVTASAAAPGDLSGLPTYDPDRDSAGFMERRSAYNDGDWVKLEDVREFLASNAGAAIPWISVGERLPETGEQVIAYRPTAAKTLDAPIRLVRYTGGERESWQGVRHGFDCICHPTHWMPLPAAPSDTSPVGAKEKE